MKRIHQKFKVIFFVIGICLSGLISCSEDYQPKPRGYFRIALEPKDYQNFSDDNCPFSFEYPAYTEIRPSEKDKCWMDIHSNKYNATIHLTYKNVQGNMERLIDESVRLTYEHTRRADGIEEELFTIDSTGVFALLFNVSGDAASGLQFIATDSSSHFLRGSLYFNVVPNQDSLAPLQSYFKEDVVHLIESLEWK